ncbi:OpgC family protein [Chelatococcus reniformis]|uniref:Membrane protein n=1 Tax=Chelatococcus reniformis TaxID=1494448 RepID=A0A916XDZ2_9HYPH|nr:OpgC domain-containing protein [Chelatococcus reniformis]GGC66959.1 membrane protein [Chelatococcus reniformis]
MPGQRIETIDLWRGLVLVMIFINHIPGNPLEHLTLRNYGFSDSAEAFVFVSGLAVSYAYFPKVVAGDLLGAVRRCVQRAVKLYGVHVLITLAALVLFGQAFLATRIPSLVVDHGRDISFMEPMRALVGLALMSHQLGYFNILPLYVALMLMAPVLLLAARIHTLLALAVSALLYLASRWFDFALPTWPIQGRWFFDPFSWQLIFTIGLVCGIEWRSRPLPYARTLFIGSLAVVWASFALVTDALGQSPGLYDAARHYLDLTKTDLGLTRLVHFLALAYLVSQLRLGNALLRLPGADKLMLLGRNGLGVFAAGSLASALGQILLAISDDSPVVGVIFVLTGILGLIVVASILEWSAASSSSDRRSSPRRPSSVWPAPRHGPTSKG